MPFLDDFLPALSCCEVPSESRAAGLSDQFDFLVCLVYRSGRSCWFAGCPSSGFCLRGLWLADGRHPVFYSLSAEFWSASAVRVAVMSNKSAGHHPDR